MQQYGTHNINFVTPEHVVPQVALTIIHAQERGLHIPIIYNTSSYDSADSLELLDGLIDIYLPDFVRWSTLSFLSTALLTSSQKMWDSESSRRLLKADDYPKTAKESIKLMQQQVGDLCFTADGVAKKGLLLRHLVMPGMEEQGRSIMAWLGQDVSKDAFVNIMEQYHPDAHVGKPRRQTKTRSSANFMDDPKQAERRKYQELNRTVSMTEVSIVKQAAIQAGLWRFHEPPRHEGFNI